MNEIKYMTLERHPGALVVASVGSAAIGELEIAPRQYAYGHTSTIPYAEIIELMVVPEYRRRGVARNLVRLALSWAHEHGFERVAVESSAKPGTPGRPFYEAFGFVARSVVLDIEVTPEQAQALVASELGGRA